LQGGGVPNLSTVAHHERARSHDRFECSKSAEFRPDSADDGCFPGDRLSRTLAVMRATAIVQGKVVRFKLSPTLLRAHRKNRQRTLTETEAVAFVEAKQRASALRRAKARRSSSQ
jgi:hypothetical protein